MSNLFRPPSPPPMPAPVILPAPPPAPALPVLSSPVVPSPFPDAGAPGVPETIDTPVHPPGAPAPTPPPKTAGPAPAPGARSADDPASHRATAPRRRWRPDTLVTSWRGVLDPRPGRPSRKTLLGE